MYQRRLTTDVEPPLFILLVKYVNRSQDSRTHSVTMPRIWKGSKVSCPPLVSDDFGTSTAIVMGIFF